MSIFLEDDAIEYLLRRKMSIFLEVDAIEYLLRRQMSIFLEDDANERSCQATGEESTHIDQAQQTHAVLVCCHGCCRVE